MSSKGTRISADAAGVNLPTTVRTRTTVAGSVSPRRDGRRCNMDGVLYGKIKEYNTALALIKEMRSGGVIDPEDYAIICLSLAKKYGISSCSIFAEIDLISARTDGNI